MIAFDLGIDIDGVLRNMYDPLVARQRKEFPSAWFRDVDEWFDYKVHNQTSLSSMIYKYWFKDWAYDLYTKSEPYPDAIEDLEFLKSTGHNIHIISAQPNRDTEYYTMHWLRENNVPYDTLHFTTSKQMVKVDCLLDDSPEQLENYIKRGLMAVKMNRPWNKDYNHTRDVNRIKKLPEVLWTINRLGISTT